jgi:hypothetical protein
LLSGCLIILTSLIQRASHKYMDRPLRDANVKEIQLNEKATRHLQKLAKLTDNSINDIIPNSVIPSELNESGFLDMNRRNLRQLMGYMGSESGIKKVTQGFGVDRRLTFGN